VVYVQQMNAALLIVNILLVAVTAAYVILTWQLSRSNAESAATAAAVAIATVDGRFEVRLVTRRLIDDPDPTFRSDYFNLGVRIRPEGANLLVHEVRLINYMRATQPETAGKRTIAEGPTREVLEWSTNQSSPVRLHRGQSRRLYSPSTWVPKGYVQMLEVEIDYSIDEKTILTYRRGWEAEAYEFFSADSMRIERATPRPSRWGDVQDPTDPD
jgi:hypothetical protein